MNNNNKIESRLLDKSEFDDPNDFVEAGSQTEADMLAEMDRDDLVDIIQSLDIKLRILEEKQLKVVEAENLAYSNLLNMTLHQSVLIEMNNESPLVTSILCVHGGWIYRSYDKGNGIMSSVFVSR